MATKKDAAKTMLNGVDLSADFHTLDSESVHRLVDVAKAVGYRAPKNRNGSTARYFFAYLQRGEK